jgi:hypothetical protein
LSEKLEELADKLDNLHYDEDQDDLKHDIWSIATELRKLSNENYAPGNSLSWDAIKPKPVSKRQGGFISRTGRKLPF